LEQRLQQSRAIQLQKPWEHSTGPKTPQGKTVSKMNAFKHGGRGADIRDMARIFTEWKRDYNRLLSEL